MGKIGYASVKVKSDHEPPGGDRESTTTTCEVIYLSTTSVMILSS